MFFVRDSTIAMSTCWYTDIGAGYQKEFTIAQEIYGVERTRFANSCQEGLSIVERYDINYSRHNSDMKNRSRKISVKCVCSAFYL